MSRFTNNGNSAWGAHRLDTFPNGASRRPNFNNRRHGVFQRSQREDGVNGKLDRLLDKMDKFELWREETDRRFDGLDPILSRETEPPLGFDDADEGEYEEFRRRKSSERGGRARNLNFGMRDVSMDERGRRGVRSRGDSAWVAPGNRYARAQGGGFPQQCDTPTSCWDPPQRFQSTAAGFDMNLVSMKPPRFDGTNASNWISRVHSYFNHLMIPDAQRLHYAVMLFDQPAADWVFNYLATNDFVTWQNFLEDVRDRFDRQGPKPVMKARLQLHRPLSSAAAMARVLELTDTHVDRTLQPPSSTTSRRPWQNREGRGQVESTPAQQSSQPLPTPFQTQGDPGRAVDQARPPRVRVSQAEKAERARLGLCYYCPDKWVVGHVCKQRLLCYADEDDEDEYDENDLDENGENDLDGSNLSSTTTDSTSSEEHLIVLDESDTSSSTDSASRGKNISNSSMCSQNCTIIDHLEEIISDARNNKKTLFMEIESVINLMKQVEVKEHAAEQAKTEAARVEMDAQNEMKELKITIKHATEANDMQGLVGVYDEKIGEEEETWLEDKEETLLDDKEESGCIGKGIKPGFGTYSSSLDGACRYNNGEVIENVLSSMAQKGLILKGHASDYDLIIKKLCGVGKTFAMDLSLKRACVDNAELEHATYECMFMALLCEGSYKGRHSTVRYVFDPGGYASPKLSTIIVASWFPP